MKSKTALLFFFILLKFGLQYPFIHPIYELHRDEFLHLDLGRHLAWGYQSVPPVIAWVSALIAALGNSVFWVRFFPALFGVLTLVVVWKTVEELRGGWFAFVLAATSVTFSALLRLNMLYQPNSLDVLCWTLLYYMWVKYMGSHQPRWLYGMALVFAFGFLNKYNIGFLALGLAPAILISEHRNLLANRHLYLAAALALVLISPNLWWQMQNDFPVLHHMKELAETQLVNVSRADFLQQQLLFFMGSLYVLVAAFVSFFLYAPLKKYRVLFWSLVFTLGFFLYFKAKGYYAVGLYPIFLAFGSVYLEQILSSGWKVYLRPVGVALPILLLIPIVQIAFPIHSPQEMAQNSEHSRNMGLHRWEDGKDHLLPQDFADMLGWQELAHLVDSAFVEIHDRKHTLILCDNYGQTGAINYYTKQNLQAVSLNADYIGWFPLETMEVRHIILVQEAWDDDPERKKEQPLFEIVKKIGAIKNPYARECGTSVYLLGNAKTSINQILESDIQERRMEQSR